MPKLLPNASFQSVPFRQHFFTIVISSFIVFIFQRAGFLNLEASMSLVSLVEWNVSLGSADVSWGGVQRRLYVAMINI